MTDRAAAIEATTAISRVVESLLKENAALRASLANHDAGMQTLRAQHQTACDEREEFRLERDSAREAVELMNELRSAAASGLAEMTKRTETAEAIAKQCDVLDRTIDGLVAQLATVTAERDKWQTSSMAFAERTNAVIEAARTVNATTAGGYSVLAVALRAFDAAPPSSEKDSGPLCYWCGHARSTHDADGRAVRGPMGDHAFLPRAADAPGPVKALPAWRYDVTGREIKIGDKVYSTSNEVPHEALEVVDFGPDRIIAKGGKAWRNTAEFARPHLRIVDPPAKTSTSESGLCAKCGVSEMNGRHAQGLGNHDFEPRAAAGPVETVTHNTTADAAALDEWTDERIAAVQRERHEESRLTWSDNEDELLAAIKLRNARIASDRQLIERLGNMREEEAEAFNARITELESALAAEKGKEDPAEAWRRGAQRQQLACVDAIKRFYGACQLSNEALCCDLVPYSPPELAKRL